MVYRKGKPFLMAAFFMVIISSTAVLQAQSASALQGSSLNDLPAVLDRMLENHFRPSVQVAMGSFTYADTQLPTPFARWFEDELRLAIVKTTRMKLFDKQVAAAMDPSIRALYGEFFGTERADSILYGKYGMNGQAVQVTMTLTDLSTGSLISETRLTIPASEIPKGTEVQPSVKTMQTAMSLSQLGSSGSPASSSQSGFVLTLSTDRGPGAVYRDGERLTLFVTSNRDAYLKIYHVDVNGVAQLIWPNRFGGTGFIKAGEALRFPGAEDKFSYVLGRPYGTEYIKAIASTRPFATMEPDFSDLQGSAVSAITRGLSVVGKDATRAEALAVYEIVP